MENTFFSKVSQSFSKYSRWQEARLSSPVARGSLYTAQPAPSVWKTGPGPLSSHSAKVSNVIVPGLSWQSSPRLSRALQLSIISIGIWCPALDSPQHTFMMGVGRQYGDIVRFACEQGYKMFGVQELLCTRHGTWNAPTPTCHSKIFVCTPFL